MTEISDLKQGGIYSSDFRYFDRQVDKFIVIGRNRDLVWARITYSSSVLSGSDEIYLQDNYAIGERIGTDPYFTPEYLTMKSDYSELDAISDNFYSVYGHLRDKNPELAKLLEGERKLIIQQIEALQAKMYKYIDSHVEQTAKDTEPED